MQDFTDSINGKNWQYSKHALDNLKYRAVDSKGILIYIKDLTLDYKAIFEYYTDSIGKVEKSCYRVNYSENLDIILVVDKNKTIITIYINSIDDYHFTLDRSIYIKG